MLLIGLISNRLNIIAATDIATWCLKKSLRLHGQDGTYSAYQWYGIAMPVSLTGATGEFIQPELHVVGVLELIAWGLADITGPVGEGTWRTDDIVALRHQEMIDIPAVA